MGTYRVSLDHTTADRTKQYVCVVRAPSSEEALAGVEAYLAGRYGAESASGPPGMERELLNGMVRIRPHSIVRLADDALAGEGERIRFEDLGAGD